MLQRAQYLLSDQLQEQILKKSIRTEHNTATLFQNTLPASRDSWITHSLSKAVALYLTPSAFFCPKFISLLFQHHLTTQSPHPTPPPQTHFDFTLTTSKLQPKGLVDIEVVIAAETPPHGSERTVCTSPPAAGLITGAHKA